MVTEYSQHKCPRCGEMREAKAPERDVLKVWCEGHNCAFYFTPAGKILSFVEADQTPLTTRLSDVFPANIPLNVETKKELPPPEQPQVQNDVLKDIDLLVFDLETTGFVAPECRILEIGCYIVRGGKIEKKHWVFQNKCEIPEKITEITGITKEIIDAEGTDPATNLLEFLPLFKRAKMNLGHNSIRFDIPFLTNYAADVLGWTEAQKTATRRMIESCAFDTAVHFKAKKIGAEQLESEPFVSFAKRVMDVRAYGVKFNLTLCAEEMKIDLSGIVAHRAMADVEVTYKVFKALPKTI